MTYKSDCKDCDDFTRRSFMTRAAGTFLGISTLPLFDGIALAQDTGKIPLAASTAKNVIYLYMSGGMSHLDTFDVKPGAETQGPTEVIGTNVDGIQISKNFKSLARHMDKIAVINSLSSTQGAHAQGQYFMHTSYEMRGTIRHPSMGAWMNKMSGKSNMTLPGHVAVGATGRYGPSAGFFESSYMPLPIGDPEAGLQNSKRPSEVSAKTFDKRLARVRKMNEAFRRKFNQKQVQAYGDMYNEAVKLMNSRDLAAFDLAKEPAYIRDSYGENNFAQGCLLARRLVEQGVRFVEVTQGGLGHAQREL